MGLLKTVLNSVNNYYNPVVSETLTSPRNLSSIKDYEWFKVGQSLSALDEMEYYQGIAYACINARAEKTNTSVLSLQVEQASGKMKPIIKHPFFDLISNPNIYQQSFKELIHLICITLDLSQKGAFLYYAKNIFGMPVGLYHLPSKHVTFELTPDGTQIQRYRYSYGSKQVFYNPDEIIHFRIPNPDNPFFSKHTAGAAKYTLDADRFQLIYQKNFYLNDASIGGIFTTPNKLSDESFNRLDKQIAEKYSDPTKAGKFFLGEDGLTYEKGSATPREADYSRSHIDTRNEICGLFRTPKSILGFVDDVNRANADASNRSFIQNTIIPFSFHIWDKIEQFIKLNYDNRLYLIPGYNLEEPYELQTADFEKGYKKWYRPNEIRQRRGLPEDWSDEDESQPINLNQNKDNGTQPE